MRFPFTDLSNAKLRPAVVIADVGRGDYLLVQVTSKRYADPSAVELASADFSSGGLRRDSYARPGKIFTASDQIVARAVGKLSSTKLDEVVEAIVRTIRRP